MAATLDMPSLGKFYRRQLLEDVLPFWFPRAYDEKNGGLYHCFDADGTLVDSDKSVWAQGRIFRRHRLCSARQGDRQPGFCP